MRKNQIIYFLNAVYYGIWTINMKFGDFIGRIVEAILSPVPKYFFSKSYKEKYYKRLPTEREKTEMFLHDSKSGYYIGCANYCFAYFYSGYSIFLSFVLIGIADKIWGHLHLLIDLLLLALPIEVCFIPAYSAVFSNDRYSKYFRQFEKEDEHWHKKWRGITILFIMGSIIFTIMGFLVMWGIDHLL